MRIYRMPMCKKAYWVRTLTFDKVTGELVDETEWSPNKTKYYDIYAPVVLGYFADRVEVKGREVTEDNIEETITYVPLGKIIPIDANGRLIPNVPTPTSTTMPITQLRLVRHLFLTFRVTVQCNKVSCLRA